MIIDIHTHLMSQDFFSKAYWDNWVELSSALSGRPAERIKVRLTEMWDESGDLLIKDMDEAGIDKSVISVADYGLARGIGEGKYSIRELNKIYAEIARKHPARLIAFVGIDPRREEALQLVEEGAREWGMKGLKLLPPAGFYPNDKRCYSLYEKVAEWRMPVLVHTGPETMPLYSKYCYPIYLDEVASDFPKLKVILAHAGSCWWPEALNIASTKPNVYLDLAGWQSKARRGAVEQFYKPLRIILDTIGASRVLFGSDWPALRLFMSQSKWVKAFQEPPQEVKAAGIRFTNEEVEAILGGNASAILSIQES